jgi:hypothetical protein
MEKAAEKDLEAIREDIEGLCQETALNLQKLCDILPTRKSLRDHGSQHDGVYTSKAQGFINLQTMMARVHDRLAVRMVHIRLIWSLTLAFVDHATEWIDRHVFNLQTDVILISLS